MSGGFINCLKFFEVLIEFSIFCCTVSLCTLSSKDPFKSHIIGNMTNYFNNFSYTNNSIENMCICNNITFNTSCTEENILKGCLNISHDFFYFKPKFIRKLDSESFCTDMQESFSRNKGKRLSYIFNFRYQAIRKINIALIVVILSYIILLIAEFCIISKIKKIKSGDEKKLNCYNIILFLDRILMIIAWIGKFVLSLTLYHYIESGDIGKYDNFLDCRNVKKEYFEEFKDIDKLRNSFLGFAGLNIINESIDKAKYLLEKCENCEKCEKNRKSELVNIMPSFTSNINLHK